MSFCNVCKKKWVTNVWEDEEIFNIGIPKEKNKYPNWLTEIVAINETGKSKKDIAFLIAAAPEMYKKLQDIFISTNDADLRNSVHELLKKARGRK